MPSQPSSDEKAPTPRTLYRRAWQEANRRAHGVKKVQIAPCGTPAAYRRHKRKGEPVDDACREAWNAHSRKARQNAKEPTDTP